MTDFDGVTFAFRHGDDLQLWAIFERVRPADHAEHPRCHRRGAATRQPRHQQRVPPPRTPVGERLEPFRIRHPLSCLTKRPLSSPPPNTKKLSCRHSGILDRRFRTLHAPPRLDEDGGNAVCGATIPGYPPAPANPKPRDSSQPAEPAAARSLTPRRCSDYLTLPEKHWRYLPSRAAPGGRSRAAAWGTLSAIISVGGGVNRDQ